MEENPVTRLQKSHRISPPECFRQAFEYFSVKISAEKRQDLVDDFYRFGNVHHIVKQYCELIEKGVLKL